MKALLRQKIQNKAIRSRLGNGGYTMVGVLMMALVMGMIGISFLRSTSQTMRAQRHVSMKNDLEAVKRNILDSTSCTLSFSSGSCTAGAQVELRRYGGATLVSSDPSAPTSFGDITVRADCNPDGDGIIVRAARLMPGRSVTSADENDYFQDPLTKQRITFADERSKLFPTGIHLCRDTVKVKTYGAVTFATLHSHHGNCWCDGPAGPSTPSGGCPGGYALGQTGGIWGSCWYIACRAAADGFCLSEGFENGVITQFNTGDCHTKVTCFR